MRETNRDEVSWQKGEHSALNWVSRTYPDELANRDRVSRLKRDR
ncbi:MAG TPA: hypothetical protein VJ951_06470 [Bacteroidales bacterium]|nr:hypothetical protein [Bacteroidales bacterium]